MDFQNYPNRTPKRDCPSSSSRAVIKERIKFVAVVFVLSTQGAMILKNSTYRKPNIVSFNAIKKQMSPPFPSHLATRIATNRIQTTKKQEDGWS